MAIETLNIPEEHLTEVIEVIRAGLGSITTSEAVHKALLEWCIAEENYLEELAHGDLD